MTHANLENTRVYAPTFVGVIKYATGIIGAIAATLVLTRGHSPLLFLALSSAQNVQMPTNEVGLTFRIVNNSGGAFTITIKDADTTTTRGTIAQNAAADIVSDGTRWWVLPLT